MGIIDQIDASVMHFRAFALHTNTPGRPLVSVIASVGGDCTHSPTCSQATNNPDGMQDLPSGMNLSTQREYWWVPASQRAALQTAGVQIAIASIGATDRHWPASYNSLEHGVRTALGGDVNASQVFNVPREPSWGSSTLLNPSTPNLYVYHPCDVNGNRLDKTELLYLVFGGTGGALSRVEWWHRDPPGNNIWRGSTEKYMKLVPKSDMVTDSGHFAGDDI